MKIEQLIKEKVLTVDGGMGTSLLNYDLTEDDYHGHGVCPDYLVLSRPDVIKDIHASFLQAGADIIETCSFGASRTALEYHSLSDSAGKINLAAARLARETAAQFACSGQKFVSGSIGPGRRLPSLGQIGYDELYHAYFEQACALIGGGVDLFQIETCQDLLQAKAAVSAVFSAMEKKRKKLPVIVQVTIEHNGRLLLGTDLQAVITVLSAFDLFAIGLNCGTGPESMHETVGELSKYNPFYCSVLPNAGLPETKDGKLVYSQTPEIFAEHIKQFVARSGVEIVGGCCGTTPEHIRAVADAVKNIRPGIRRKGLIIPASASLYTSRPYNIEPKPLIVGERTNATGSRKFRKALLDNDIDSMTEMAKDQENEGAHMLDLSLAYTGVDEVKAAEQMVKRLSKELRIPLCMDSTSPEVIETALKNYAGKALINSINLEDGGEKASKILNIAKKYGASVIALTIDENGMAKTSAAKVAAAEKIIELTRSKGLKDSDVFIDPLTFTLGSGDPGLYDAGSETLKSIPEIKNKFPEVNILLGVSNISYGLSEKARKVLNTVFMQNAVRYGLDAAIFHAGKITALHEIPENVVKSAEDLIFNRRDRESDPLEDIIRYFDKTAESAEKTEKKDVPVEEELVAMITGGKKKGLEQTLKKALEKYTPLEIINDILLKGMSEVGEMFGKGTLQLPFVLRSAETMKSAADILSEHLQAEDVTHKAVIVLATVKGDIHDIGKNLVDIILSNNGYKVHNIGIDCTPQAIAQAALEYKADFIGLSGLLVSSAEEMKNVVRYLGERKIDIPVLCGGAALNHDFVAKFLDPVFCGGVYYAKDAFDAVRIMSGGKGSNVTRVVRSSNTEKKEFTKPSHDYKKPSKPFDGKRILRDISFVTIEKYINKKRLFKVKWAGEKSCSGLYEKCVQLASNLKFNAVYGYFNAEEAGFSFAERKTGSSPSLNDWIEKNDFVSVFLASAGREASDLMKELYESRSYTKYYYWYGFAAEAAEALAEYINEVIREELSIAKDQGRRYSPGYSVWPDLKEQKKICRLLDAGSIGVTLTENNQLDPELSVSGVFIYHPDAGYKD